MFIEPSKSRRGECSTRREKTSSGRDLVDEELTLKPHKSIKIGEIYKMGKKKWQIFAAAAMTVGANMMDTAEVSQMDASSFLSRIK